MQAGTRKRRGQPNQKTEGTKKRRNIERNHSKGIDSMSPVTEVLFKLQPTLCPRIASARPVAGGSVRAGSRTGVSSRPPRPSSVLRTLAPASDRIGTLIDCWFRVMTGGAAR
jgi:hypothetical protein